MKKQCEYALCTYDYHNAFSKWKDEYANNHDAHKQEHTLLNVITLLDDPENNIIELMQIMRISISVI